MKIEQSRAADHADWLAWRRRLWPQADVDELRRELTQAAINELVAFLARDEAGQAIGFAEVRLRSDPVNGCDTSPVVFLEGIFVDQAYRRHGVATALCDAAGRWGRSRGCTEFASDALLENLEAQAFHKALGFEERERMVAFRRRL